MQGKGLMLLPGEVVLKGSFRSHMIQGKTFVMVGGQVMFICDIHNGRIQGDIVRVQLDAASGVYYGVNMRTESVESSRV